MPNFDAALPAKETHMQYTRTLDRTFAVAPDARLRIANRSGELTVIGEDRSDISLSAQISVHAESQREADRQLDDIQIPISAREDHVEVGPPDYPDRRAGGVSLLMGFVVGFHGLGTRVNMVARVPRDCVVNAEHRSGPLRISGLGAGLRAESRSGRSEVTEVAGDVTFESRSGTTEIRRIDGDLEVESRSGRLEVEGVSGKTTVRSRSGSVVISDIDGPLVVESRAGRIQIEDARGAMRIRSHAGAVEVRGRVVQPIDIELHSGHVKLAVTRDSAFFMDAETHVGSVRSELPVNYLDGPPSDDAPVVRVRTHTGAVRVVAA